MFSLPPIPSWPGMHVLVVHFPIALLITAPLFVIIGVLRQKQAAAVHKRTSPYLVSALILMLLGTAGAYFAIETGEAAGRLVERTPEINVVLQQHMELADLTRTVFSALTVLFAAILLIPRFQRNEPGRVVTVVLPLAFLVLYAGGLVVLANTADHGGRLVHQFGVRALVAPEPGLATGAATSRAVLQ